VEEVEVVSEEEEAIVEEEAEVALDHKTLVHQIELKKWVFSLIAVPMRWYSNRSTQRFQNSTLLYTLKISNKWAFWMRYLAHLTSFTSQ